MKKIVLILSLLGSFLATMAQVDKTVLLEKLRADMLPQTKDHDPYKYNRENFILSCLELRTEVETDDCEFLEIFIQKFDELDSMSSDGAIRMAIGDISRFQCREAYNTIFTHVTQPCHRIVAKSPLQTENGFLLR
ncbi:MAG: hypothetical protein LBV02_08085 [Bacteroidales bacterium]|jgi:hypothetical protein|nr:hypothetical protein [Bacteroidales bacterium]